MIYHEEEDRTEVEEKIKKDYEDMLKKFCPLLKRECIGRDCMSFQDYRIIPDSTRKQFMYFPSCCTSTAVTGFIYKED